MKTEKAVQKLLEKTLNYIEKVEDFSVEQVPIFVEELLHIKFVEHLVKYFDDFLISLPIFFIGIGLLWFAFIRKHRDGKTVAELDKEEGVMAFLFFVGLSVPLLMSILLTDHLISAYKIKYTPRVYLVEYLKGEVR